MGITIHYQFDFASKDAVITFLSEVRTILNQAGIPVYEKLHWDTYLKVYNSLYSRISGGIADDFTGFIAETNEVFPGTEGLNFMFFHNSGGWHLREFCKTEFGGVEAHKAIGDIMLQVGNVCLRIDGKMAIFDEGGYLQFENGLLRRSPEVLYSTLQSEFN